MFFEFHSKRLLENSVKTEKYRKMDPELLLKLEAFEVADEALKRHDYFTGDAPVTLLIDEIESIWSPIAAQDDWNLFEKKLSSIRSFRGVY